MKKATGGLSIRIKVAFILLLAVSSLLGVTLVISKNLLLESYQGIENRYALVNSQRVLDAFQNDIDQLDLTARDWAWWDDTYTYTQDQNEAYAAANLGVSSIANLELSDMMLIDSADSVIASISINEAIGEAGPADELAAYIETHREILLHESGTESLSGVVVLPSKAVILSARQILKSDGTGPVVGTLIFTKLIDESRLSGLRDRTHLEFSLYPIYGAEVLPEIRVIADRLVNEGGSIIIEPLSLGVIGSYSLIEDINHTPVFLLRAETVRDIYANGLRTVAIFVAVSATSSIILWILISILLEFFVLRNLFRLSADLSAIGKTTDGSGQVRVFTHDEIGGIARVINSLFLQLSKIRYGIEDEKLKAEETVVIRTRELREERAKLLSSIQSLPLGFAMFNAQGEMILDNLALRRMLGLKKRRVCLDDVAKTFANVDELRPKMQACLKSGISCQMKNVELRGGFLEMFMNGVVSQEDGANLGSVLLIEDVTDSKAFEKNKSEFVSVASHQLRTPLSIINWYVELLQSPDFGQLNSEQKTYLGEVEKSSQRMVVLINTLLDVSRLELGGVKLSAEPIQVVEVVRSVVKDSAGKVAEQKLNIVENYGDLPLVKMDPKNFRMVVENIFSNAVSYTPEGGTVTVSIVDLATGGQFGGKKIARGYFGFSVSDTGYGIPEQQQKFVFDKFFRADNILSKDESGTGLGLFLVKTVLTSMGGKVWFESKINQGTTFYVTVPAKISKG